MVVTSNHISILGGVTSAVKTAKEKLGYLHKVAVEVSTENEVREAIAAGADVIVIEDSARRSLLDWRRLRESCRVRLRSSAAGRLRLRMCVSMPKRARN